MNEFLETMEELGSLVGQILGRSQYERLKGFFGDSYMEQYDDDPAGF